MSLVEIIWTICNQLASVEEGLMVWSDIRETRVVVVENACYVDQCYFMVKRERAYGIKLGNAWSSGLESRVVDNWPFYYMCLCFTTFSIDWFGDIPKQSLGLELINPWITVW